MFKKKNKNKKNKIILNYKINQKLIIYKIYNLKKISNRKSLKNRNNKSISNNSNNNNNSRNK